MLNDIKGFHIEPTNICMLKCPRCSRTEFIDKFGINRWSNYQIDLAHFKSFFDIDLTGKLFELKGNEGDPIYYRDLIPMVAWIKSQNANVAITTNGSYKKAEWWEELCSVLTESDTVIFSIDGTPDNFTQYRINADWESIQLGISIVTQSQAKTRWKYIPFSFNENDIESARAISNSLGIQMFYVDPSDRWTGETDSLKPMEFTGRREPVLLTWQPIASSIEINSACKQQNNHHYISATGYYMPCCYVSDHRFYYKSEFYKERKLYNISNTTLTKVLTHTEEFYRNIETTKHTYCTYSCPKL